MLTKWEQGLCSCGQPIVISHHPDNDGWFDVTAHQCHSCAKLEQHTAGATYKPDPGEKLSTAYTRPASKPLTGWPAP